MDDENLMLIAYWIDGPRSSELIFRLTPPSARIFALSQQDGCPVEDYTVTELFAKVSRDLPRYRITAKGRELLEKKSG